MDADIARPVVPVITIDGPTASGKGTVAQRVAHALGYHFLDSGAMYRLAALVSHRAGIDSQAGEAIAQAARTMCIRFHEGHVWLETENVSDQIRAETIGNLASRIAVHPAVREALVARQRAFRQSPGLVADGRDMGTVIFPDAPLKIFLTASVEARANRRYKQLIEKGFSASIENLSEDLRSRDARDTQRATAPLKPAEGALLLDTSDMSIDQAVAQVLAWYDQTGISSQ